MTKAWQIGVYGDDWAAIVHADTRAEARTLGTMVDGHEFTSIRAIRLPELDGKLITRETMIEAGWPEEWIETTDDILGYIDFCGCDVCKASRRLAFDKRT